MKVDAPMNSYAARLASFNVTLTAQKKGASDAKCTMTLKWPHVAPSIPQLANAGFFYKPTASNPDNTTCYLCHCNLDGWEEDDEPIAEHLKHSPNCGWANIASIEKAVENGERELEDPASEKIVNARTRTFGSTWPHENKKGWVCKIQKMVGAGWYYCPTPESDDFVRCAYCNLSLDGWEPKDDPYDEHQRRSPDCLYFSLSISSSNVRTKQPKKSRNSKASRISTQSTLSIASEISSLQEIDLRNNSVHAVAEIAKPTKGGKKGSKGKKAKPEVLPPKQDVIQTGSSFVEPEDDDFEVKVAQPKLSKTKGRKRKSAEMAQAPEILGGNAPKKRRNTIRDGVASVSAAPETAGEPGQLTMDSDLTMTDNENKPRASKPTSKKAKKGSKKRGSSTDRKVSSKSTASEASLRAGKFDDDQIDMALAEDLDRPLTDDGENAEPGMLEPPKGRRLTRSKTAPTATDASTAPTRRNTRNSTVIANNLMFEPHSVHSASHQDGTQLVKDVWESVLQPLPNGKTKKKTGTRKASAKQKSKAQEPNSEIELPDPAAEEVEAVKPRQTRGGKPSEQILSQSNRRSNASISGTDVNIESKTDTLNLNDQSLEDDSEHETDTKANGRPKRGKKALTATKITGGRRVGPNSRNIGDVVQAAPCDHSAARSQDVASASADGPGESDLVAMELKKPTKKRNKNVKAGPKSKENKIASNTMEVGEAAHGIDRSEIEKLMGVPESPVVAPPQSAPQLAPSTQSSDAENHPPSSRPSQSRPLLAFESPLQSQGIRVPLGVIATPLASPSKGNFSKLRSTFPWTAIDIEHILHDTPDTEKENEIFTHGAKKLTSPEKSLTVEEWIKSKAQKGEAVLRNDCERLVNKFEDQGVRALKTLEGIVCVD